MPCVRSALAKRLLLSLAQILRRVSALVCFSRVSSTNWFCRVSALAKRLIVCRAQILCRVFSGCATNWFYRMSVLAYMFVRVSTLIDWLPCVVSSLNVTRTNWFCRVSVLAKRSLVCRAQLVGCRVSALV